VATVARPSVRGGTQDQSKWRSERKRSLVGSHSKERVEIKRVRTSRRSKKGVVQPGVVKGKEAGGWRGRKKGSVDSEKGEFIGCGRSATAKERDLKRVRFIDSPLGGMRHRGNP